LKRFFTDGRISAVRCGGREKRFRAIGKEKGRDDFRQDDVEVPKSWSQTATNIVASKYFHRKNRERAEREGSVRAIDRRG